MDQKVFLRLREFAIEFPDGMIVGFGHLQPIKKGWVVKINGQTDFEGENGMLTAIKIASQTTRTIAGWTDGEIEMWDVVEIFKNEDEATEAGKENENLFIYQIETGSLKWLG
jgi:hypothetical protein